MTRTPIVLVGLLAALALAPAAVAQPTGPPAAAQPDAQQRRDKIKQRIRALRAYTLTEQLSLDEATAARLFPALAKYDEEFDRLHAARAALQKRLADAGAIKDGKAVDVVIDEVVANQRAIWDTEAQRTAQLRSLLTPAQVARLMIVLPAIERRIQRGLRKATQKAPQKAPNTSPGAANITGLENPFDKPAPGPRAGPSGDTELAPNPFDKPSKRRAPRTAEPCDPFSSSRGCRK